MKPKGVLSVDDTYLLHYGMEFEHITILWDPVEQYYAPAHNLVTLHYSDDQTDVYTVFKVHYVNAKVE